MAQIVEYLARLDDARVYDAVEDVQPMAAGHYEAVVAHEGEVLGEVRLGQASDREERLDGGLLLFQYIEYLEALGVGQDLVNQRILLVCLLR